MEWSMTMGEVLNANIEPSYAEASAGKQGTRNIEHRSETQEIP
jgi:hypothetical protein